MNSKEILNKIRSLSIEEQRQLSHDDLVKVMDKLSTDEIIEITNIIGYPVFIRLCAGELNHKIVILQDGAAVIIENEQGQILLQSRADRNKWGLPGGCQNLREELADTAIREVKEESNLDIKKEDLELIDIVSGDTRKNSYPNGDTVYNNTALYRVRNYSGELRWDEESKDMRFFNLDNLPSNQNDPDLIEIYKKYIRKKTR